MESAEPEKQACVGMRQIGNWFGNDTEMAILFEPDALIDMCVCGLARIGPRPAEQVGNDTDILESVEPTEMAMA